MKVLWRYDGNVYEVLTEIGENWVIDYAGDARTIPKSGCDVVEEKEMKVVFQGDGEVYSVVGEEELYWILCDEPHEGVYPVLKTQCVVLTEGESPLMKEGYEGLMTNKGEGIYEELVANMQSETKGPIKSDGGSSSYYKLNVPAWLIEKIVKEGAIETEDLIEVVFDNDFDYGNIFKSLVRAYKTEKGCGKSGNEIEYEMNKISYSALKVKALSKRRM